MTPPHFLHFCDYLPFENTWPLICTNLNSLYLRIICTKFYWNWLASSGEEDFFFNANTTYYNGFPYCGPSRPRVPWLVQTWIYIISESFYANMSSSGSVFSEKILNAPTHFCIFVIISPLKRTWPLICKTLNSLYLRMICTKFYWNWLAGSREDFLKNCLLFCYYLPLGKGALLHF
jgi:hypothetical protein